jgi:hypothetical protein
MSDLQAVPLPDVKDMTERELLEENVRNTREIARFAAEVAEGMQEFYSKFNGNPIMRLFGG